MFFNNGGFRRGRWRDDRPVGEVGNKSRSKATKAVSMISYHPQMHYHKPDGTVEIEIFQEPRQNDDIVLRTSSTASNDMPDQFVVLLQMEMASTSLIMQTEGKENVEQRIAAVDDAVMEVTQRPASESH